MVKGGLKAAASTWQEAGELLDFESAQKEIGAAHESWQKSNQDIWGAQGVGESFKRLRSKLRAASYTATGQNWEKLFAYYDRDNSGEALLVCVWLQTNT